MKKNTMKNIIISVVVVLLFAFGVNMGFDILYAQRTKEHEDKERIDIGKIAQESEVSIVDNEILFLLMGVDSNGDGGKELTRSDTIMLCKLNLEEGSIDILSIPRDTRTVVKDKITKINHAHSMGGADLSVEVIRETFGIDVDYYVEVDFDAVIEVVDAIGGIEFEVPEGINFVYGGVEVNEGKQVLNGEKTLTYLRHRKSYITGDVGRIKAQQDFIKVAAKQILDKTTLDKLPSLISTYFSKVKTNLTLKQLLSLATNADKLSTDKINTYIVPGTDGYRDGVSYYFADPETTDELIKEVFPDYVLSSNYKKSSDEWQYLLETNHPSEMDKNYNPTAYNND